MHFIGKLEQIKVQNCDGLCSEQFCDFEATHYKKLEADSFTFNLPICQRHALSLGEMQ